MHSCYLWASSLLTLVNNWLQLLHISTRLITPIKAFSECFTLTDDQQVNSHLKVMCAPQWEEEHTATCTSLSQGLWILFEVMLWLLTVTQCQSSCGKLPLHSKWLLTGGFCIIHRELRAQPQNASSSSYLPETTFKPPLWVLESFIKKCQTLLVFSQLPALRGNCALW